MFNMSKRALWVTQSQRLRGVIGSVSQNKVPPSSDYNLYDQRKLYEYPITRLPKFENGYWMMHQGLQFFTTNSSNRTKANVAKDGKIPPSQPATPRFSLPNWIRWVVGSILAVFLPFWKEKWAKIRMIEEETEKIIDEIEAVANIVENVAVAAENVSEELANRLPHDNKLKKAALTVEHVSEKVAQDAQLTLDVIHKVEKIKNTLDDFETIVDPVISQETKQELAKK